MPILRCKRVGFYSEEDEMLFHEWLRRIRAVRKVDHDTDTTLVHVQSRVSRRDLWELLGVFERYHIDMRQLAQFRTRTNEEWFADPKMYFHKKVFGTR